MAKRTRSGDITVSKSSESKTDGENALVAQQEFLDPSLAELFASSSGPVKVPPRTRYENVSPPTRRSLSQKVLGDVGSDKAISPSDGAEEELSSVDGDLEESNDNFDYEEASALPSEEIDVQLNSLKSHESNRPRKRKLDTNVDDVEGRYMLRLAKEDEREEVERQAKRRIKRQRLMAEGDLDMSEEEEDLDRTSENEEAVEQSASATYAIPPDVPQHESLAPDKDAVELEKSSRTVFLANVSAEVITVKTAKKTLLEHLASFFDSIPASLDGNPKHRVESIRFRSTAYAGTKLPKRAAFAKKNLMSATTKSTNAYVVYSTAPAAQEAVKRLNGTVVLGRHLRVDGVAHPAKTDHRRCVFVGNLGFVDDESMMEEGDEGQRKRSKIPSDVEEGLWRQFSKAGTVESVRVIRDEKTRVGKGFAYVQFLDANSVEAALLFDNKKYPPMLPRILRVTRAKPMYKTALASQRNRTPSNGPRNANLERVFNPKAAKQQRSLQARAGDLLGKAGAAKLKRGERPKDIEGIAKMPETVVFEGYRASANAGRPKDLKLGGAGGGKKKGKPRTRSSRRGMEWKKGGGRSGK